MPNCRSVVLAASVVLTVTSVLPLRADQPAPGALTEAERAALVEMLERGSAETEALVARAEGDLFTRKPAADRWSVSEVLEHIAATEEMLLGMLQGALAAEPDPEAEQVLQAMPVATFAGRVQDRSQRAEAPEAVRPTGAQTREEGIARYQAARATTLELVRTTAAPVARHTTATPMGKLTAHHLMAMIAAHNLRHNQQMAEVLEQLAGSDPAAAQ